MVKSFQHKRCRCNWILWSQQLPVSKQLSSGIKRQKQKGKVQLEVDIFISQMEKRDFFHFSPRAFGNPIHTDVKDPFQPDWAGLRRAGAGDLGWGWGSSSERAGVWVSAQHEFPTQQQNACRPCYVHLASVYPIIHYVFVPPLSGDLILLWIEGKD